MLLSLSGLNAQRLPAPLPVWHASTDALGWAQVARAAAACGVRDCAARRQFSNTVKPGKMLVRW